MQAYELDLRHHALLVLFVPGIVYLADAVGTQTEAVVIRGLSVGVPISRIAKNESITGLMVGAVLAVAFLLVGNLVWNDSDVIATAVVALFAACVTASLIAMSPPWLLDRLGADPGFGAGPLATVVQDLLSLLIYFSVASITVA